MSPGWAVGGLAGSAADLHARDLGPSVTRTVTRLEVERSALVLGSTQATHDVDERALAAAGIDLARRRSGGGAVLVVPGESLWIDIDLPAGDALWDDDVGVAAHWVGHAWTGALAMHGIVGAVHTGALLSSRWSRRVCFAGIGPGEVVVDGRKAVGLAQRRTRVGARFQCVVNRRWDPAAIVALLALDDAARADAIAELERSAMAIAVASDELLDALVAQLP